MKSRLIAIAMAVSIAASLLIFTIALADPADPFSASAQATAVNGSLIADLNISSVTVGVLVGQQTAGITGTVSAVQTGGSGVGVSVTEASALIDANVQLIASESYTDTTDPGNDTDTDVLANIETVLLGTTAISSTSESESLATRFTTGRGFINEMRVNGGPGGAGLISTGVISETAHTESTAAGFDVSANSAVSIEDLSASLGLAIAPTEIITAAAITSSADVLCDDLVGNESAMADYNFVDLYVQGQEITVNTPGTEVTVTVGTTDVAVLTIGPEIIENVAPTSAQASVVALRLEFISDFGLIETGSVIDVGASEASCDVSQALAITNQGMEVQQQGLPAAVVGFGFIALTLGTIILLRRRRMAA